LGRAMGGGWDREAGGGGGGGHGPDGRCGIRLRTQIGRGGGQKPVSAHSAVCHW